MIYQTSVLTNQRSKLVDSFSKFSFLCASIQHLIEQKKKKKKKKSFEYSLARMNIFVKIR